MQAKVPRVSIGMPLYNAEVYLTETLESILSQSFRDFELIISDNASTDRTQEICRYYASKDSRIRYYRNQENLGATKNFNRVFELSVGEYFKWAAYDDPCAPEYLQLCVEALDQNPDRIMAYPRTILINAQGGVIEYHDDAYELLSPRPHLRFRKYFYSSAWCHPVFGLIRRAVLEKTGLIGNYASSDKVLLGELAILGKTYEVPQHLAYRRIHPQISTVVNKTDEDMAAWFDPQARGKVMAPRWRRFIELIKVIARAGIPPTDKFLCYLELARFYLSPQRLTGVGKDVRQIGRVITRPLTKPRNRLRNK